MKKVFQAGQLNRRIELLAETTTKNEFNERIDSWVVVKQCKAAKQDIELKRENEDIDDRMELSQGRTNWMLRYDKSLFPLTTKKLRELVTGQLYDIQEVQDMPGYIGQWMKLICVRVQQR